MLIISSFSGILNSLLTASGIKCIIQVEPMPISKAEGIMCVDIMAPSTSVLGLPSYSLIQHLLLSAVMIKASVYPKWDVLHFWSLDKASFVFSTYIS